MSPLQVAQRIVEMARAAGAEECDALVRVYDESTVSVRLSEVERLIEAGSRAVGLRVINGKRTATCSTSDFSDVSLRDLARNTVELATISEPDEHAGLPDPTLFSHANADALQLFDERLQQDDLLSFGAERFVLIETGWAALPRQLPNWLFQMQLKGYRPILAHPERYQYFRGKTAHLAGLKEQGCRLQLNLMSLAGRYGDDARRMARTLIREKLVDFVSSDLHRARDLDVLQKALQSSDYQHLCALPLTLPTL